MSEKNQKQLMRIPQISAQIPAFTSIDRRHIYFIPPSLGLIVSLLFLNTIIIMVASAAGSEANGDRSVAMDRLYISDVSAIFRGEFGRGETA
jgi:hypothetical protein